MDAHASTSPPKDGGEGNSSTHTPKPTGTPNPSLYSNLQMQSQSLIHDDLDIPALTARADLMAADLQQTRVAAGLAT